ncbi:MAG: hypothetical protein JNJ54_10410 [Myxococcaceae bacterium]|nr:hypothetical protein [Myxococcaceae bacterium]
MSVAWCRVCGTYHEPRAASVCRRRAGRGPGGPVKTLPGAILHGLALGVLLGFPVGALTQHPVPFAAVALLVTVVRTVVFVVQRRRS